MNIGNLGTGTLTIADGGIVNGPVTIATNAGCDWNTQHRRGRGQSGGCTRHAHRAERRIWRRHRYDQLQSHIRRLRVCAGNQRQRHRQCARGHHHAHRCQHLQRTDERQRGHVAGRRDEHVQPKFASDGRERRNARSQWLQPDRTRRHQCRPGEHGHGHRAGHDLDDDQLHRGWRNDRD